MRFLLTILLFSSCFSAQASLISLSNGYSLNTEREIVRKDGKEWLQWSVTRGRTLVSAWADLDDGIIDGKYYGTGWRVASNIDMSMLFNDFKFGADFIWDTDRDTNQFTSNDDGDTEDFNSDPEKQFVTFFGHTQPEVQGAFTSNNPYEYTSAFFGDINISSSSREFSISGLNRAAIWDDALDLADNFTVGQARLSADNFDLFGSLSTSGIAFVRDTGTVPTPPVNVSEPEILSLFMFAIAAVAYRKRDKKN